MLSAKQKLMRIVENGKGDDLERARHAFRHLGENGMNMEWDKSGKTCQQILVEYVQERAEWQAAYDLACSLPD